jgi:hypothetical protein
LGQGARLGISVESGRPERKRVEMNNLNNIKVLKDGPMFKSQMHVIKRGFRPYIATRAQ